MFASCKKRESGFTLVEMLAALGIFLLVTGAAFSLLSSSQRRYQTESQILSSFQEARLGLDQMVRDINDAGFPPPSYVNGDPTKVTSTPFAWSPGYPTNPCTIGTNGGGTCTTSTDFAPGDFDIIIETEPNPLDPACTPNCQVQWIRYQLGGPDGTTLMRGMAPKTPGANPDLAFTGANAVVPFVQNVVNQVCPPQLPNCQTAYPGVFTPGTPVPIFQYTCDTPSAPQNPLPLCTAAGVDNSPKNIRDVLITLIVAAPLPDATTGKPRLVQLNGRGRRINPNQ
jgi:prepilin-type N-terminal cleavage/methylation domain-containing protein